MNVRLGFVGTGFMGQCAHLRNYASLEGCEVVALAEMREDVRLGVAARYNIPKAYAQASEMLAKEKLDGIVASQQFTRHGIVLNELLKAKVPVFIEKPLAASLPVGEALAAADKAAGGKVMVGYHKRSDPAVIWARAEIDRLKQSGEIGNLRYIRMTVASGDYIQNSGFDCVIASNTGHPTDVDPGDPGLSEQHNKDYFYFVNFFIHQLNLIRHLLGEDYKLSYTDPKEVVIVGHGLKSGVPITLECIPYTTISEWEESALIGFDSGYMKLTLPAPLVLNRAGEVEVVKDPPRDKAKAPTLPPYPVPFHPPLGPGQWSAASSYKPKMPFDHAMRIQALNFIRFVRGEAPPPVGAEEAVKDLRLGRDWIRMTRGGLNAMPLKFTKLLVASESFESAGAWDVDGDGVMDIVSGSFWHKGPDFRQRFFISDVNRLGEYWNDFSTIPMDIAGNGRTDFVTGGWGGDFRWVECPADPTKPWTVHPLGDIGNVETTRAADIDGDGHLEIIPNTPGAPLRVWKRVMDAKGRSTGKFESHVLKREGKGSEFSGHGLGFGDLAGNGRTDILLCDGWLEAPEKPYEQLWKFHKEYDLGCASIPILVADVNGDGLNELIVGQAHNYGLDWYEQKRNGDGTRSWIKHPIDPFCSQYHDMHWVDIDGDGKPELVTGKRFRAHCGHDPGEFDDLGIYYFKWNGSGFSKEIITSGQPGIGAGCGIHFVLKDLRGTGRLDVIAPGKDGLHVFFNEGSA